MKFEFKISSLIETLKQYLGYWSGKRASDPESYFRHTACEADAVMLMTILESTIARLSTRLGAVSGGYTISGDYLEFLLKSDNKEKETEMRRMLMELILGETMESWLELTGKEGSESRRQEFETLFENFRLRLRSEGSVVRRRMPPI